MSTRSLIAALLGAAVLGGAQPAAADEPCRRGAVCRTAIPVTPNLALPIYALWPLGRSNPTIRRLVIVIHGSRRNAGSYFRRMNRAAREAGVEAETQVIAPHFRIAGDDGVTGERLLYWDRGADWKQGDDSALFPGGAVGSFAALDRMRAWLARMRLYPNLGRVLIAGHSAGGQFVQRYAMGSAAAPDGPTVPVRYVVANPSSYMYLDGRRPDGKGDFAENRGSARCLVNAYKYGPEGRNDYMAAEPLDAMVRRYRMRDVVYLLGGSTAIRGEKAWTGAALPWRRAPIAWPGHWDSRPIWIDFLLPTPIASCGSRVSGIPPIDCSAPDKADRCCSGIRRGAPGAQV